MTPTENENNPVNRKSGVHRTRRKRSGTRRKIKRTLFQKLIKILKTSPLKILAPFFLVILVLLTILFFLYDDGEKVLKDDERFEKRFHLIQGLLLSDQIIDKKESILITFGNGTRKISLDSSGDLISLEKLRGGYALSPVNFISCGNEGTGRDSSTFVLTLVEDRLYLNAHFKNIFTDEVAGFVDKKHWTSVANDKTQFYSDDNLFEVLDNNGYIMFSMQFTQAGSLSIRGYFVGERCVYIAQDNGLSAEPKTGNYIERTVQEIKSIKRIYTSK